MKHHASREDEIAELERRLDIRRDRLRRHYDATRSDFIAKGHRIARVTGKLVGWAPLVMVAGGLAVGFAASRMRGAHTVNVQPRYVYTPAAPPTRSRNTIAALLGIVATGMRLASSNEIHALWRAARALIQRRRR
jgi:hypothetical protein